MEEKKDSSWYAYTECKGCKKRFRAKRKSRWGEPRSFCSKSCISECRTKPVKHVCINCKNSFDVPLWQVKHKPNAPRKFCGVDCKSAYWAEYGKADKRNIEGRRHHHASGYVYIHAPEHPATKDKSYKYLLEHRVVMEKKLGRYLQKGENVHHLNGIKHDNRPENLELWVRIQPNGMRSSDLAEENKRLREEIERLKGDLKCQIT